MFSHQPVVASDQLDIRVEVVVLLEQPAELLALVGLADLLGDHPAQLILQPGLPLVIGDAFFEELESGDDPAVALAVIVAELDGDVVGDVPRLVQPDVDEVGLDLGDLFEGGGAVGPVFLHLIVGGLLPEDVGRHAPQPQRGELDRDAGGIDLAESGLAEAVLAAELGELAAGRSLRPLPALVAGLLNSNSGNTSTAISTR